MIIRSRAPLRIGIAGGGTDLASYSEMHGGAVFNSTISMYAYCTITPTDDGKITLCAPDRNQTVVMDSVPFIKVEEPLILHKGVYNRIVRDYNGGKSLSFKISTSVDAPIGSGLGGSSTLTVAILEAFSKWLLLNFTDYEKARLAYEIERIDLKLAGGKQDQYCAVFGGFNMMEFKSDGNVVVNSLRMDKKLINELECSLLLFYRGLIHDSDLQQKVLNKNLEIARATSIINEQIKHQAGKKSDKESLDAMHRVKENAYAMKDAFFMHNIDDFAKLLHEGWENKKKTASIVSNTELETIIDFAMQHGAKAVKVSGAGGGGFIMMLCDPSDRQRLLDALKTLKGAVYPVKFVKHGVESWVV